MATGLTEKQARFVKEYLVDLNATRAAFRAGYRGADDSDIGYKNLRNPKIRAAIAEAGAPQLARLGIDAERVVGELGRIATANVLDYMRIDANGEPVVDFSRLRRDSAAALSEVTIEEFPHAREPDRRGVRKIRFRLHDKLAALRELARLLGLPREEIHPEADTGPQYDPHQVARAVIAVLEQAAMAEEEAGNETRTN